MATKTYIWDELTGTVLMEVGDVDVVYTHAPDLSHGLISQRRGDDTSFYHFDAQGSTRQLTDSDQTITDEATYSAFGKEVASSGATANPWGFKGALGYYSSSLLQEIHVNDQYYAPALGRWLSQVPLTNSYHLQYSPSDLFALLQPQVGEPPELPRIVAQPGTFTACANQQDSEKDPCEACNAEVAKVTPTLVALGIKPAVSGTIPRGQPGANRSRACLINFKCDPGLCGKGNNLLGQTGLPKGPTQHGSGRAVWVIDLCISCRVSAESLAGVIAHELLHARRFCNTGKKISGCKDCLKEEGRAYRISCMIALKSGLITDVKRCVQCGRFFGCGGLKDATGSPCIRDLQPECTFADIGVSLTPADDQGNNDK